MRRLRDAEGFARPADDEPAKREKHRRETCALCGGAGLTEKDLYPLRSVGRDGNLVPLQWAHNACRRPIGGAALLADRLVRGIEIHPDPTTAALLSGMRDSRWSQMGREERVDVMDFMRQRIRAAVKPLPYAREDRLA